MCLTSSTWLNTVSYSLSVGIFEELKFSLSLGYCVALVKWEAQSLVLLEQNSIDLIYPVSELYWF